MIEHAPKGTVYLCPGCGDASANPRDLSPCKSPRLVLVDADSLVRADGRVVDARVASVKP